MQVRPKITYNGVNYEPLWHDIHGWSIVVMVWDIPRPVYIDEVEDILKLLATRGDYTVTITPVKEDQ